MTDSPAVDRSRMNRTGAFFGVVADKQTYGNLLYLLLAFPLGMIYYVLVMVGFSLGVGLSILLIGLVILVGTVLGLRWIASFERRLANLLLGTTIPAPNDVDRDSGELIATATAYIRASSTWRGLGFVVLKFWIGILAFILLVTFLGTAIELLLLPVFPDGVFNIEVMDVAIAPTVTSITDPAVAVPVGAVLGLCALHVLNAYARANASIAVALLGPPDSGT